MRNALVWSHTLTQSSSRVLYKQVFCSLFLHLCVYTLRKTTRTRTRTTTTAFVVWLSKSPRLGVLKLIHDFKACYIIYRAIARCRLVLPQHQ